MKGSPVFWVHTLTVLDGPAGLVEQSGGGAKVLADAPGTGAVRGRRPVFRGEHLFGQAAAEAFEDFTFLGIGILQQAAAAKVGVVKVAVGAGVGVIEQVLVRPLEVKGQRQGFAHPAVLEHRLAQVENKALDRRRALVRELP